MDVSGCIWAPDTSRYIQIHVSGCIWMYLGPRYIQIHPDTHVSGCIWMYLDVSGISVFFYFFFVRKNLYDTEPSIVIDM